LRVYFVILRVGVCVCMVYAPGRWWCVREEQEAVEVEERDRRG
jgi:hypothetical protein